MFVLIDMKQLAITHKHRDREVLAGLSWIECLNAAKVLPLGRPSLFAENLTPLEMQKIYLAATGAELKAYGNMMATVLHEAALRMPESVANKAEVEAQVLCVLPADRNSYRYVAGAKVPENIDGLFAAEPLTVERNVSAEQNAAKLIAQYAAPAVPPLPAGAVPAASTGLNTPAAPAAPRAPSAPRQGGSRETIFKVADEMWAQAGSPRDPQLVLKLRKEIMTVLESQHGVKKTTSSTALGDWQKQRV